MTLPRHRSRTKRRVKRVAPGGKNVLHYVDRKPQKARCGSCGVDLKGVPRERPAKMRAMSKTKKRPERKFGGVLCGGCVSRMVITAARSP